MKEWWQKAVIYQIYPRSFSDSTNNGIGDLKGIINNLNHIKDLGIDAVWLSPFFPSPQTDFGYDITDYNGINPEYGTMDDFDELLTTVHSLGIKIILDMVLNHTSNQHPWFEESRSSIDNPKREWYIWKEGRGKNKNKPPNNWKAIIGGSMWEFDKLTGQFYLHQFLPCQPDLNWWNLEVQEVMFNSLKFWLDKGVDGFRLDIIHTLYEDKEFQDNPRHWRLLRSHDSNIHLFQEPKFTQFLPETIEVCTRLRKLVDSYQPPRVLIGEAAGGPKIFRPLYGKNNDGLNLVFNFKLGNPPFSAAKIKEFILESETIISDPYWPCVTLSNHDGKRMISRYGDNEEKAKLLTLLLLTLRCTPVIYYGEEIGMRQVKIAKNDLKDPISNLTFFRLPLGRLFGRDGCRTPMQWTNSKVNAGFSPDPNVVSWLPIDVNADKINVESQMKEKKSMLDFYKSIIHLRKKERPLIEGTLDQASVIKKNCLNFVRKIDNERIMTVLNFDNKTVQIKNPSPSSTIIFSTIDLKTFRKTTNILMLRSYEGLLLKHE